MLRVGREHIADDHLVERSARGREAQLDLIEQDPDLPLDRQLADLAGLRVIRRDVRHEHEAAALHHHRDWHFAPLRVGRERLDANDFPLHDMSPVT